MDGFDALFRQLEQTIDRVGWAVQGIGATDDKPQWCYTVGLAPLHAELMIRGLDFGRMAHILNTLADRVIRTATPLPLDEPIPGLFTLDDVDLPVMAIRQIEHVRADWGIANSWHRALGRDDFERCSILWADRDGIFPNDKNEECDELATWLQEPW